MRTDRAADLYLDAEIEAKRACKDTACLEEYIYIYIYTHMYMYIHI